MRKSFFALLLVIACCLTACFALADGSCGANLTWSLSSSGILTISGSGDMMDCSYGKAPWADNRESIQSVVVEDGVTNIGDDAFYWCRELKTVQLPESLTSLGDQAFENCSELLSVNIPSNVTSIGSWTFYGCEKLASLTLPEGLTSIEDLAFCDCESLRELTIPASVTFIDDDRVFMGCQKLEEIVVAESNPSYTSVDGVLYNYDQTTLLCYPGGKADASYTVPESVTSINKYGFYWNERVQSISVPGTVKTIGSDVFAGCSKLTKLVLSEGIESIDSTAFFRASSLTSISFPASLVSLGDDMFESCDALTSLNVAEGSTTYAAVDGILFNFDKTTLIAYPAGIKKPAYVVPDSVTTIGDYAFLYNDSIVSITLPDSLVTIGQSAFSGCKKISSIQFPRNLTTIDDHAFSSCDGLINVTIPANVYVLGNGAFNWCRNLVSVTIENPSVSFDDWGVFDYCNNGLTLTGIAGSTTETHAKKEEIPFVAKTFDQAGNDNASSNSWTCSGCGTTMDGGKFCSECGAAKPEGQKCSNCGYVVEAGKTMKFCPECGTKFK